MKERDTFLWVIAAGLFLYSINQWVNKVDEEDNYQKTKLSELEERECNIGKNDEQIGVIQYKGSIIKLCISDALEYLQDQTKNIEEKSDMKVILFPIDKNKYVDKP